MRAAKYFFFFLVGIGAIYALDVFVLSSMLETNPIQDASTFLRYCFTGC